MEPYLQLLNHQDLRLKFGKWENKFNPTSLKSKVALMFLFASFFTKSAICPLKKNGRIIKSAIKITTTNSDDFNCFFHN